MSQYGPSTARIVPLTLYATVGERFICAAACWPCPQAQRSALYCRPVPAPVQASILLFVLYVYSLRTSVPAAAATQVAMLLARSLLATVNKFHYSLIKVVTTRSIGDTEQCAWGSADRHAHFSRAERPYQTCGFASSSLADTIGLAYQCA